MAAQEESICMYETENNLVVAITIDFDLTRLKLFMSEMTLRLVVAGDLYREANFPVRINPMQGNVSISENMIRLELPKKEETFVEMTFSKNNPAQGHNPEHKHDPECKHSSDLRKGSYLSSNPGDNSGNDLDDRRKNNLSNDSDNANK